MHFKVKGVERKTGKDVTRRYEAGSEEAVALLAKEDGILIEHITLASPPANAQPAPMAPAVATIQKPPSPHDEVAHASERYTLTPDYTGLRIAGSILRWYGFICYALGLLALTLGVLAAMSSRSGVEGLALLMPLGPAVAMFLAGGIAHGMGAGCAALRDIAKNSWR